MSGFLIVTGIITLVAGILQLVPGLGMMIFGGLTAISLGLLCFALAAMAKRILQLESSLAMVSNSMPGKMKDSISQVIKQSMTELRYQISSMMQESASPAVEAGTPDGAIAPPDQASPGTTRCDDGRCTTCGYDRLTSFDKTCPKCHRTIGNG